MCRGNLCKRRAYENGFQAGSLCGYSRKTMGVRRRVEEKRGGRNLVCVGSRTARENFAATMNCGETLQVLLFFSSPTHRFAGGALSFLLLQKMPSIPECFALVGCFEAGALFTASMDHQ